MSAEPDPIRTRTTEISVVGANCPWCFNDTLDVVRSEPGVVSVLGSVAGQCIRVEHDDVAVGRLLSVVRDHLHADDMSSAERVMVVVEPHLAERRCTHHRSTG